MKPDDPLDTAKGLMIGLIFSVVVLIALGLIIRVTALLFMLGWNLL